MLSDERVAECEGVTAGDGVWWEVPLSELMTGDSVLAVLDTVSVVLCVFMLLYPFVRGPAAGEGISLF